MAFCCVDVKVIGLMGPGLFRFLLAFLVLIEHVSRFQVGKVSVMAFFVLSGFWVTRTYCENYRLTSRSVFFFYQMRFLRIWPLFFLMICLSALTLTALGQTPNPQTWIALPILGIATHAIDPIGVSWSLDIELQFYILLPLIVAVIVSKGLIKSLSFALAAWILGLILAHIGGIQTVLYFFPMFIAGMLVHFLRWTVTKRIASASLALSLLFPAAVISIPQIQSFVLYGSGDKLSDFNFAMIWALFLVPYIAFNVRQASSKLDYHFGRLSFVLYLIHFPIIKAARILVTEPSDVERLVIIGFSVFLSTAIYALADPPLERWRRNFSNRTV